MKNLPRLARAALLALAASTLAAHFSWVSPLSAPLVVGETVDVQVGNGHHFPESEAVMKGTTKIFVIAPSGSKTKLNGASSGKATVAPFKVAEAGMHRFYFVNDRGVLSRTTQGYRSGGRDKYPRALESYRLYRTGVAYGLTPGAKYAEAKPVGLDFEVLGRIEGDSITLTVLKGGKPCPNAEIHLGTPKDHRGVEIGRTGPDGVFRYTSAGALSGRTLFLAEFSEKAPAGADYDRTDYTGALHLDLL